MRGQWTTVDERSLRHPTALMILTDMAVRGGASETGAAADNAAGAAGDEGGDGDGDRDEADGVSTPGGPVSSVSPAAAAPSSPPSSFAACTPRSEATRACGLSFRHLAAGTSAAAAAAGAAAAAAPLSRAETDEPNASSAFTFAFTTIAAASTVDSGAGPRPLPRRVPPPPVGVLAPEAPSERVWSAADSALQRVHGAPPGASTRVGPDAATPDDAAAVSGIVASGLLVLASKESCPSDAWQRACLPEHGVACHLGYLVAPGDGVRGGGAGVGFGSAPWAQAVSCWLQAVRGEAGAGERARTGCGATAAGGGSGDSGGCGGTVREQRAAAEDRPTQQPTAMMILTAVDVVGVADDLTATDTECRGRNDGDANDPFESVHLGAPCAQAAHSRAAAAGGDSAGAPAPPSASASGPPASALASTQVLASASTGSTGSSAGPPAAACSTQGSFRGGETCPTHLDNKAAPAAAALASAGHMGDGTSGDRADAHDRAEWRRGHGAEGKGGRLRELLLRCFGS
ncbi:hypothetical protein GPECTOR_71g566 [Gonium pectorale]|uniref:Uncharacterized protein n=1 Tax=Gonium pectorale TaxID=33097 RepID=A0A150G3W0_GONPE|nr:hypothetical protein GPECTOR_71g566 [Gonium pectorale]|eukprot:KXZ44205.1 hypothetical protein GPECTOR_71g566 [Gonium pectorale]